MANKIRGIPGLRTHIQQGGCPHTVPRLKAKKFIHHPFDLMHRRTGASTVIPLRPWDTEEPRMRACAARVHKEGKSRTGSLTRFSAKRAAVLAVRTAVRSGTSNAIRAVHTWPRLALAPRDESGRRIKRPASGAVRPHPPPKGASFMRPDEPFLSLSPTRSSAYFVVCTGRLRGERELVHARG